MSTTLDVPTVTPTRRRWVVAVLCLGALVVVTANMALNVALPGIGHDLDADVSALAWVVDSYVLCFAGLLLPAGVIGDRFGRRATMLVGLAVFVAAALGGATAGQVWQLVVARAVMGLGAALVTPSTLAILTQVFPPAERTRAIAIWAAVAGGGVALSLTWAGWMLDHFRWGSIFLGMALLAAVTFVAGLLVLPEYRSPRPRRLDLGGAALSIVGVTGLLYGVIQGADEGWTAPAVLTGLAVGVVGLALFLAVERRHDTPMLDLVLLARRGFSIGALTVAVVYLALFGMYFVLAQYLQLVRGLTPLQAGLLALPAGLAQLVVAIGVRPVLARLGVRWALTGGLFASITVLRGRSVAEGMSWATASGAIVLLAAAAAVTVVLRPGDTP